MRKFLSVMMMVLMLTGFSFAQEVYINEVDYDQSGSDTTEFIELVGPINTDLSGYTIELVNGGNGVVYNTIDLTGYTIPADDVNGYGFFVIGSDLVPNVDLVPQGFSIQNGGPDGILLKFNGVVVDGISYEGDMTTISTPNPDFTSGMAINAADDGSDIHGSIGRITLGFNPDNQNLYFAQSTADPSPGEINTSHGQTLAADEPPIITDITPSAKIPDADEDLVITATITDDNAVAVAEIHFKVDNGVNNAVVMTNTGGDTYEGTIASSFYDNGQVLDWWIYVEDNGANITESQHNVIRVGTMNIADLHEVDADGISVYEGEMVKVQGVVTVEDSVFSSSSLDVYIQDATGGINVYLGGAGDFDFPENDEFAVIGTVTTYNGKLELVPDNTDDITFIGNATPVVPQEVTLAQILSDPEGYEGKLVIVRNVSKLSGNWGGNSNLEVSDDGGTTVLTLRIDRDTDIDENTEPAWPQDVTAIVGQYDGSVPYDGGYQILPRRYTDFSTPQGQDEFPVINTNSIPFDAFEPGVQTITADVTDDNQVSSVELYYYLIINDTWPTLPTDTVSVSMNLTTGDTYAADVDLSNLSNGDGFVYWVEATDNIGQKTETNPFEVLVGTSPLSKAHVLGQSGLAYDGFYGKFTGVITAEPGLFSSSYFFMQDATGGVEIYRSGGFDENYVNGDSLLVTGYIGEFYGLSQLNNYTITLLKSGATVTPPEITTADVGEMYEGMLVTIPDLDTLAGQSTEWVTTGSSFNLDMGDEEGNIVVRIATDTLKNSPEPQWPSTITGVLTLYQGNYQLQPRYPSDISTLLSVGDDEQITEQFEVYQNYPNPFNPSTIVAFNLPKNGQVSLKVFNIMGQVVKSMDLKGKMGRNEITVDFSSLSTGIYFYQISFESNVVTKKMMFIK
ncbi:MAG: hypothetical protein Kow00108_12120 [Calditrichia bacterium]